MRMPKALPWQASAGRSAASSGAGGTGTSASPAAAPGSAGAETTGAETAGAETAGAGTGSRAAAGRLRGAALRRDRLTPVLRRHWMVGVLLLGGLVLRLLAQLAYRPALLYIDSLKYLYNAWPDTDPVGYKVPLKAILLFGNLETVAAVQHLLGLGMAVALYAVLLRRGAPRWLAAVAVAPLLFDAYQLQIEQTVMPDVWFEALIVAGLALLLWRPRPAWWVPVAAGLALGASATIRQVGEILVLPALIYLVIVAGGRRRAVVSAVALCGAFGLPILVYCSIAYVTTGHFRLSRSGASVGVYGRMGEAADCATLKLPGYERALCPTPRQQALGPDGLDHNDSSPLNLFIPPPGLSKPGLVSSFNRAVLTQQPLSVLGSWGADAAKLFAVRRVTSPGDTPIWRWQFQGNYPTYGRAISLGPGHVIVVGLKYSLTGNVYSFQPLSPSLGGKATVMPALAFFLRHYQLRGGYTPGPVYLLAVLAGLIGSVGVARRGRGPAERQVALACLLFFTTAAAVLLASDIFEFSWRYQLPALVTLPPAGALGIAVIMSGIVRRRHGPAGQDAAGQVPELAAPAR